MEHGTKASEELANFYHKCCNSNKEKDASHERLITLGIRLGGFLIDAGWYAESEKVLLDCKDLCILGRPNPNTWCHTLDCCHKWVFLLKDNLDLIMNFH